MCIRFINDNYVSFLLYSLYRLIIWLYVFSLISFLRLFNISIDSLLEINKTEENNLQKKEKISKITKYCNNLSLQELDFIIKIIKSMQL